MSTLTPSPPPRIHTPPTPKHGYSDSWEPFSPRKSSRLLSKPSPAARTPSPRTSSNRSSQSHHQNHPKSPRRRYSDTAISPAPSPRKKTMPPHDANRRASGHLTAEGTAAAASSLGLSGKKSEARPNSTNISSVAGMLPTPAKTPSRKHPSAQNEANIAAIARNLFHGDDEVMPDPKKKRAKKYVLDSFNADEDEDPIQIFTDSHERIPEVDNSNDNPFYGDGAAAPPEPTKRRSKRKQVSIPGEGKETVEEASRRDDGLVYVFRGKKIFRKFKDDSEVTASQDDVQEGEEEVETSTNASKRLTRSSIKPRLLFPPKVDESEAADVDEEADTDIEKMDEEGPETPMELVDDVPGTPSAPKFAPASPPSTARATRSGNKLSDELTPMKSGRGGKRSPFDGWRHTKSGSSSGHKRPGGELDATVPAKRARA